ncbi:hypothetical protein Bbelb_046770 [Branchiostoma belcheri]|nr:hypothetical protein Bbelb_046770 [Branchiostoma belcheri]
MVQKDGITPGRAPLRSRRSVSLTSRHGLKSADRRIYPCIIADPLKCWINGTFEDVTILPPSIYTETETVRTRCVVAGVGITRHGTYKTTSRRVWRTASGESPAEDRELPLVSVRHTRLTAATGSRGTLELTPLTTLFAH